MSDDNETTLLPLADGRVIDLKTRKVVSREKEKEPATELAEPVSLIASERRNLSEITEEPKLFNVCCAVHTYEVIGVPDYEIAAALGATDQQIADIRASKEYETVKALFLESVEGQIRKQVRGLLASSAGKAARKMIKLLDSESEDVVQKAARDILDRTGHRPADVLEHRHSFEDELVIRVINSNAPKAIDVSL